MQANQRRGISELKQALLATVGQTVSPTVTPLPQVFASEVAALAPLVSDQQGRSLPPYLVERLLLDISGYLEREVRSQQNGELPHTLSAARDRLAAAGFPVPAVEAVARYDWVARVLTDVVTRPRERPKPGLTHSIACSPTASGELSYSSP